MADPNHIDGVSRSNASKAQKAAEADMANQKAAVVQEASEDLQAWTEEGAFLPGFMRKAESLETRLRKSLKKSVRKKRAS